MTLMSVPVESVTLGYSEADHDVLFKSLIISKLVYCCSVWGDCRKGSLERINKFQFKALRRGLCGRCVPIEERIRQRDAHTFAVILHICCRVSFLLE